VTTWAVHVEIVDLGASDRVHKVIAGLNPHHHRQPERVVAVPVAAETAQAATERVDAFLIASGLMRVTAIRSVIGL
jgi:hypothetical protein